MSVILERDAPRRAGPADGSCRTHGKRQDRVSHRSLDGAQNAPPTTLHRPLSSTQMIKS